MPSPGTMGPEASGALDLATRLVVFGRGGFDLALIALPSPAEEDAFADALGRRLAGRGIALATLSADDLEPDPLAALRGLGAVEALLLKGLHAGHAALARRLNVQRDRLVGTCPVPWVVVGHPEGIRTLADAAPDFVDFASLHVGLDGRSPHLGPRPGAEPRLSTADIPFTGDPVRDRLWLSGRWDELAVRLRDDLARDPEDVQALRLLAELENARGRPDEARRLLDRALRLAERAGDERTRALCLGQLAGILAIRGELDEALRIRRDEELPVYEKLGDARSRAITLGSLADIHRVRGEVDEAERLLREEVLPVLERLGDTRSRAVALGGLANLHLLRGEVDEAERLLREEVLPVFERLGDVRECAWVRSRLAAIHLVRGEVGEAERLLREEVLPVFERLGDVRGRAVAIGMLADIRLLRGELDEALRIRREEELPAYEKLGDRRGAWIARMNLALTLDLRGRPEDAPEVARLLRQARDAAAAHGFPRDRRHAEELMRLLGVGPGEGGES